MGKRSLRNGRTWACELRVRERDGTTFKGQIIVGTNEPWEVAGVLAGQTVSWREEAPGVVITAQGTLKGAEICFTFTGLARGHGDLKRRDGS